jgi:hypothetical protein
MVGSCPEDFGAFHSGTTPLLIISLLPYNIVISTWKLWPLYICVVYYTEQRKKEGRSDQDFPLRLTEVIQFQDQKKKKKKWMDREREKKEVDCRYCWVNKQRCTEKIKKKSRRNIILPPE